MPNFIEIGEITLEKSVTKFLHPDYYFGSPGGPPGPKVTSLGGGVHQPTRYLPAKFRTVLTTPFRYICCQTSSILLPA